MPGQTALYIEPQGMKLPSLKELIDIAFYRNISFSLPASLGAASPKEPLLIKRTLVTRNPMLPPEVYYRIPFTEPESTLPKKSKSKPLNPRVRGKGYVP